MRPYSLVLASASPRRAEILSSAGIPFQVRPVHIDETRQPGELPVAYVRRLAQSKALAARTIPTEIVLAADTTVALDSHVLEKPANLEDARRMIELLAGGVHEVSTGICLRRNEHIVVDHATTRVRFVPMTAKEIDDYAASGEPMDKAGGYGIQGLASKYIDYIEGCYFNVVGLPVSLVWRRLAEFNLR